MHSQSVILLSRNALVATQAGTEGGGKHMLVSCSKISRKVTETNLRMFLKIQWKSNILEGVWVPAEAMTIFLYFFVDGYNCSGETSNLQLFLAP